MTAERDIAAREVDGGTPELAYSSDAMHIIPEPVDPKQGATGNTDKPKHKDAKATRKASK